MAERKERKRASLYRGSEAMQKLQQENEEQARRREASKHRGPMRFYVRKQPNGPGYEEHEVVVLDDDLSECPAGYEHNIPGPNNDWKNSRVCMCIDDTDDCPICRAADQGIDSDRFDRPRFHMYATILDLTPYTIKNGPRAGTTIDASRKLLPIPHAVTTKFLKIAAACKKQHGTTRGMVLVLTKEQQMDARIGEPQLIGDVGNVFDFMHEDELEEYANDEVRVDGKVLKEEGEDIEPFNYETDLENLTAEEMRVVFNLDPTPGSEADGGGSSSRRRSRKRASSGEESAPEGRPTRRRRASTPDPEEEPDEDDNDSGDDGDEESPPPARGRSRRSRSADPEPAPEPGRRRRRAPQTNADLDDEIPF